MAQLDSFAMTLLIRGDWFLSTVQHVIMCSVFGSQCSVVQHLSRFVAFVDQVALYIGQKVDQTRQYSY